MIISTEEQLRESLRQAYRARGNMSTQEIDKVIRGDRESLERAKNQIQRNLQTAEERINERERSLLRGNPLFQESSNRIYRNKDAYERILRALYELLSVL